MERERKIQDLNRWAEHKKHVDEMMRQAQKKARQTRFVSTWLAILKMAKATKGCAKFYNDKRDW